MLSAYRRRCWRSFHTSLTPLSHADCHCLKVTLLSLLVPPLTPWTMRSPASSGGVIRRQWASSSVAQLAPHRQIAMLWWQWISTPQRLLFGVPQCAAVRSLLCGRQFFPHSMLVTLTQVLPTSSPLCNRFLHGCPRIFLLLSLLRLNFALLVSDGNFLKQTTHILSTTYFCINLGFIFDEHLRADLIAF